MALTFPGIYRTNPRDFDHSAMFKSLNTVSSVMLRHFRPEDNATNFSLERARVPFFKHKRNVRN